MRGTLTGKNYAVLLRCPMQDQDTWVVLQDRTETLQQILAMPWDFECSIHGVQRELPVAANENGPPTNLKPLLPVAKPAVKPQRKGPETRTGPRLSLQVPVLVYGWVRSKGAFHEETSTIVLNAGGCLVELSAKVELGDMLFISNRASRQELECRVVFVEKQLQGTAKVGLAFKIPTATFWRVNRTKPRLPRTIRVWVRGVDRKGDPFTQSAYTIDISEKGARLEGVGNITKAGETLELKRGWSKARYRVVWIGPPGTPQANQIGICCMEDNKNLWSSDLAAPAKHK